MNFVNDPILDISKLPQVILLEKYNAMNAINVDYDEVVFATPVVSTKPGYNTSATFTPKLLSRWLNGDTIYYNRINIASVLINPKVSIPRGNAANISDTITTINTLFGINLRAEDYFDNPLPAIDPLDPDAEVTVTFSCKPGSYLFYGSLQITYNKLVPTAESPTEDPVDIYSIVQDAADPVYKSKVVCYSIEGREVTNFKFLRNAVTVTESDANFMLRIKNGDMVIFGNFQYRAAIGQEAEKNHVSTVIVIDRTGKVLRSGTLATNLFGSNHPMVYEYYPESDYIYALDTTNAIGTNTSRLYRFDLQGQIDVAFTAPDVSYVPTQIKVCADGKFYAVTGLMSGMWDFDNDPGTPDVSAPEYRIDRYLTSGVKDGTYNQTVIRTTGGNAPWEVIAIAPVLGASNAAEGLYIYLKPPAVTNSTGNCPVVNGVSMIPGNEPEYGFLPLIKLSQFGLIDTNFQIKQPFTHGTSLYNPDAGAVSAGRSALVAFPDSVVYVAPVKNPLTGYAGFAPIHVSALGAVTTYAGQEYYDTLRWSAFDSLYPAGPNGFVVLGQAKLKIPAGGYETAKSTVGAYYRDARFKTLVNSVVSSKSIADIEIAVG